MYRYLQRLNYLSLREMLISVMDFFLCGLGRLVWACQVYRLLLFYALSLDLNCLPSTYPLYALLCLQISFIPFPIFLLPLFPSWLWILFVSPFLISPLSLWTLLHFPFPGLFPWLLLGFILFLVHPVMYPPYSTLHDPYYSNCQYVIRSALHQRRCNGPKLSVCWSIQECYW